MRPTSLLLRTGAALALLALVSAPALAAEATNTKDRGPVDVELPPIFAPMTVASRLESYAYITVALTPASAARALTIREKMPFLQDAFLRELNKGSIVKADDPNAVDTEAVKARLTARMNAILPAGTVTILKVEQIVMAPLRQ
jgi:hypothetical protein